MAARLRLTCPEPTESQVLRAVLRALEYHPRVAWVRRLNSFAGRLARQDGKTSQFLRAGWVGAPDIIGQLKGGRLLSVEVKRPSGTESDEQADFRQLVTATGGLAIVARRVEDVWEALACEG